MKCALARQLLDAMEAVDSLIKNSPEALKELGDSGVSILAQAPSNPINTPTLELLCRRGYARFRGFENVFCEGDWKRPNGKGPADWKSKVDFEVMGRIDPQLNPKRNELLYDQVENEIRGERTHDAAVATVQDRLAGRVQADPVVQSLMH